MWIFLASLVLAGAIIIASANIGKKTVIKHEVIKEVVNNTTDDDDLDFEFEDSKPEKKVKKKKNTKVKPYIVILCALLVVVIGFDTYVMLEVKNNTGIKDELFYTLPETIQDSVRKLSDKTAEASGMCGADAYWLYGNNMLVIYGTGTTGSDRPWQEYDDNIYYIIVKEGITKFSSGIFSYMENVVQIVLPDTLETLGEGAIIGCSSLRIINLTPNLSDKFTYENFYGCSKLEEITSNSYLYTTVDGVLYTLDMYELVYCPCCNPRKSIDIPEGVYQIDKKAFAENTIINYIKMPNTITTVEERAFSKCTNLGTVELSNSLTEINTGTFYMCSSLKKISIPNSVYIIKEQAFQNSGIEKIYLEEHLFKIYASAFDECKAIEVYFNGDGEKWAWISRNITNYRAYLSDGSLYKEDNTYHIPGKLMVENNKAIIKCQSCDYCIYKHLYEDDTIYCNYISDEHQSNDYWNRAHMELFEYKYNY